MNQPLTRSTKLALLLGIVFPWAQPAAAVDWVGPTSDTFWSTASNWSILAAPGAADDVLFGLIGSGGDMALATIREKRDDRRDRRTKQRHTE